MVDEPRTGPDGPAWTWLGTDGPMARAVSRTDWSRTPLGPPEDWPQSLRTALSICLSSRFPLLVWWGPDLVQFYNDAYVPALGDKHPVSLGRPAAQCWAEAWDDVGPLAAHVLAGEGATYSQDQLLLVQRHGYTEESYWTFSYSPVQDETGGVGGVFIAVNDTTERVVGERRLRVLRELGEVSGTATGTAGDACRAAVDVLARHREDLPFVLVYLRDDDGSRLAACSGARAGSAIAPERLPRPGGGNAIWQPDRGDPAVLRRGLARGHPGLIASAAVGDAVPDEALILPLTAPGQDEPFGTLVAGVNPYRELDPDHRAFVDLVARQIATVVSDALAFQAEHVRAEALAELDRAKTDFFAGVSHEFRTPLTLIAGPLATLRAAPAVAADPRLAAEVEVAHRNGLRLGRLVDTLLDFSRLQAGRAQARFRPVDLAGFTAELASMFRSATDRAGLDLEVDCPPLPAPVYIDPGLWEKVVLNLLSNAVTFTVEGRITVRCRAEPGGGVVVEVADTGIGIPEPEIDRLFDRFHQVPGARGRSAEGSGIGLALAAEAVALHGGTIEVHSTVGAGSTLTVRLPGGHRHLPADQIDTAGGSGAVPDPGAAEPYLAETRGRLGGDDPRPPEPGPAPTAPSAPPGRVLLVDDNADMRGYLTRLLAGYSVRTAADAPTALAVAREDPPDLVVTDVMMPGPDGFALVAALRADPNLSTVPIVVLSARAGQESAVEGLASGADDYLVKPFTAAELLARVRAQVRLSRARRREAAWRTALVAALQDGFFIADDTGRIVEVNAAFETILGYGADGLPYDPPFPWWPDRDDQDPEAPHLDRSQLERMWAEHTVGTVELPMRHRDGHRVWISVSHSTATDPETGRVSRIGTVRDVTGARTAARRAAERDRAEQQVTRQRLHSAQERNRALLDQLPAGVFRTDAEGSVVYSNDRLPAVLGIIPSELRTVDWAAQIHPEDRERVRRTGAAASREHAEWLEEFRVLDPDGRSRWVRAGARPLFDPGGRFTGHLGTCIDTTAEREAEEARRRLAAERAALAVSRAANARMDSLVAGLSAVVWEADARSGEVTFVSEHIADVLGHPVGHWLGPHGANWLTLVHPDDRERVAQARRRETAAGRDHELTYRVYTADGRIVWLHDLVHVVCDPDGTPHRLQGMFLDVTASARREQATALLAEVGGLRTAPGTVAERLQALVRAAAPVLADLAVVSLSGPDGLLHPVAAARPGESGPARSILDLPGHRLPDELAQRCAAGRPFVVDAPSEALLRAAVTDEAHLRDVRALGARGALVTPLIGTAGRLLGNLTFVSTGREHRHDAADLDLAAELGRRAALMVESDRIATRERQLHRVTALLAVADGVPAAAAALAEGVLDIAGARAVVVLVADADGRLSLAHQVGYRPELVRRHRSGDPGPVAEAVRDRVPVWLHDDDDWRDRYPELVADHATTGYHAGAALPLTAAGRVVGLLWAAFATPRTFDTDEREFLEALAGQAAVAFERAALADTRRHIAETLQRSLLPAALPELDRVALAARYRPAGHGVAAGGDWYDVVVLDEHRVAAVVGDVVGHGAGAAAVMGQLRSALSAALMLVDGPAAALAHLDRFAAGVEGAEASTAACVVLDTRRGELRWATAGHPLPLLVTPDGSRYLDGVGRGPLLGFDRPDGQADGVVSLPPGSTVVLYTDGLVERRGESLDTGMDRLAAAAAQQAGSAPDHLVDGLLDATPDGEDADDVAVLAVRVLPGPLEARLPARPEELAGLRRTVAVWATACGLPPDQLDDLQLALGEAVANSVEHAYAGFPPGAPGTVGYAMRCLQDGGVAVEVSDHGAWRPPPADPGHRGRGLRLIHLLGRDVRLAHDGTGTTVGFTVPAPAAPAPPAPGVPPAPAPRRPADVRTRIDGAGRVHAEVHGDVDLSSVDTVRAALDAVLDGLGDGPSAVVVDLRHTTYLSSAGVGCLVGLARRARERAVTVHLDPACTGVVARAVTTSGLDRLLGPDPAC